MDKKSTRFSVTLTLLVSVLFSLQYVVAENDARSNSAPLYNNAPIPFETLKLLTDQELCSLLAPIALFPDSVLSHVLIASTYPLEVVQAEHWLHTEGKYLSSSSAIKEADKKDWDTSVKRLIAFPEILTKMSEDVEWTTTLGDNFLADNAKVLNNVQLLRHKALQAGSLKKMKNLQYSLNLYDVLIDFNRQTEISLPFYDTSKVFGNGWPTDLPPINWLTSNQTDTTTDNLTNTTNSYQSLDASFYTCDVDWPNRDIIIVNHYEYLYPSQIYNNYDHQWHHTSKHYMARNNNEHNNYSEHTAQNDKHDSQHHDLPQDNHTTITSHTNPGGLSTALLNGKRESTPLQEVHNIQVDLYNNEQSPKNGTAREQEMWAKNAREEALRDRANRDEQDQQQMRAKQERFDNERQAREQREREDREHNERERIARNQQLQQEQENRLHADNERQTQLLHEQQERERVEHDKEIQRLQEQLLRTEHEHQEQREREEHERLERDKDMQNKRIQEDRERAEHERQREQEANARAEHDRQAQHEQEERAERERQMQHEQEERERLEREKRAKEEQEERAKADKAAHEKTEKNRLIPTNN